MKKLLVLSMALGIWCTAQAQKVRLRSERFEFQYFHLPEKALSEDITTYTAEVTSNARRTWAAGMLEAGLKEKYLKLHGFEQVEEQGDLQLELDIGSMKIVNEKRVKSLKSAKKGDVKGNRRYSYKFTYSMPLELRLMNGEEELFAFKSTGNESFASSHSYPNLAKAKKARRKNKVKWMRKERRERIDSELKVFMYKINSQVGYLPDTERLKLLYAKVKKAPSLASLKEETMAAKALIESISATEDIPAETKRQLQQQAAAWADAATPLNVSDKHEGRLYGAYLHNAMVVSYAVDDYGAAQEYARQLLDAEQEKREAKRMLDEIEGIEERIAATGMDRRHNDFGFEEPDWEAMKEAEKRRKKMGLHENAYERPVSLHLKTGEVKKGIFVVDTSYYEDMVFFDYQGNIRYYREGDEGPQRLKINFLELDSLTMGDRHIVFESGDEIKAKFGVEAPFRALEPLKEREGTTLYFAFPEKQSSIDEGEFDKEYWLSKKGTAEYLALESEEELSEEAAAYFNDCPALSEKIAAGQYDFSEDGLLQLLQGYADCE